MVNYDQEDGISVSTNKLTSSVLTVRNATARHGGNYTCAPANARQSSVYVHVLKGESGCSVGFESWGVLLYQIDYNKQFPGVDSVKHTYVINLAA